MPDRDGRRTAHEPRRPRAGSSVQERDWRQRKKKLDAAAAAIILQEYLDRAGN